MLTKYPAPSHMSHSQVTGMLSCGNRYRLERLMGAPSVPGWALIGGSVVHSVTEDIDRRFWNPTDITPDAVAALCEAEFEKEIEHGLRKEPDITKWHKAGRVSKDAPNKEDEDWWRKNAPVFVQNWLDFLAESTLDIATMPNGEAAIEIDFNITQYGVPFKGGIDRIMQDRNTGELGILDLKSGSREPTSPYQLAHYRDAVQELFGVEVRWAWYFMNRTGKLSRPFDLAQCTPDMTLNMVAGVRTMIEQEIYLPNIGPFCGSCGVRQFCTAVGGSEAPLWAEKIDSAVPTQELS